MCRAALEEWEMGWARDADGMRRPRIDGCLSPSTIEGGRWWRRKRSSSVSTEKGLDVRFYPTKFFFAGFFVAAKYRHLQFAAIFDAGIKQNTRWNRQAYCNSLVELALASSLYFRPSSTGDVNYDQTHPPIDSRNRDLSQMHSRARSPN
ncbi:hypothetical protein G5I_10337 [Acromyrmex echinatior]|uniref:Uncharacterized protein n=1 Tax=Acromyrmex echinatior TaxID=103372 RepID=F4WWM0_ACREC|nr:hypothetical protein G5I_10337 [Acromyrmex echinatior]